MFHGEAAQVLVAEEGTEDGHAARAQIVVVIEVDGVEPWRRGKEIRQVLQALETVLGVVVV